MAAIAATTAVNFGLAASDLWRPAYDWSSAWLHPTLLGGFALAFVSLIAIRLFAGLRAGEVGLRSSQLLPGVLYTLVVWGGVQAAAAGFEFLNERTPKLHDQWAVPGVPGGSFLGQIFGNALAEELLYRGFLFVQFAFVLGARGDRRKRALWIAALASALVFALSHIPNRLVKGNYDDFSRVLSDQLGLFGYGLFSVLLYARTKNLIFVIGVHALINYPTMFLAVPDEMTPGTQGWVFLLTLPLLFVWSWLPFTKRSSELEGTV